MVFQLAADMGGMGFIENNKALCMLSVLTNTHMLMAARETGVSDSSTLPPPASTTETSKRIPDVVALKEEDAYPALPEDGYGWEKLFSERMCRHFEEDFGLHAGWLVITMSTDRSVPGRADVKRRLPPSAAR